MAVDQASLPHSCPLKLYVLLWEKIRIKVTRERKFEHKPPMEIHHFYLELFTHSSKKRRTNRSKKTDQENQKMRARPPFGKLEHGHSSLNGPDSLMSDMPLSFMALQTQHPRLDVLYQSKDEHSASL